MARMAAAASSSNSDDASHSLGEFRYKHRRRGRHGRSLASISLAMAVMSTVGGCRATPEKFDTHDGFRSAAAQVKGIT
jgi:hypothetical protein